MAVRERIQGIFSQLRAQEFVPRHLIWEVFTVLYRTFLQYTRSKGLHLSELGGETSSLDSVQPEILSSTYRLESWALSVLDQVPDDVDPNGESPHTQTVRRVQRYIEKHLSGDVSLQTVAGVANLHPVYLSRLYKSLTGENISDFIHSARMARATHLLEHTDLRVFEITAELGYQNPQYFSKVFRAAFGMTPNQYRERK